jgi:DMSO/TMAO reductase YedYZ molybdopterin-dependent catalytic subunit
VAVAEPIEENSEVAPPTRGASWLRALVCGSVVAVGSTAAGALVGALASVDSPVASVADRVIDGVPQGVREWAIRTFGTKDKLVLGVGIVVILAAVGTLIARYAIRRRWLIPAGVALFAFVGVAAGGDATPAKVLGALVSALFAYAAFALLVPHVEPVRRPAAPAETAGIAGGSATAAEPMVVKRWDASVDRREFVAKAGGLWAATAVMSAVAAGVNRREDASVASARRKLPTVRAGSPDAAPAPPASAGVGHGVTPFVTSNEDFYRIDTAFLAPRVTLDDWHLEITGAVDNPMKLTYDDLLDRHVVERYVTLCCVSNEVGGDLVGNAKFLGVPLAELLEEAGVKPAGTQVAMTSVDGWTCGFPTELAVDGRDALVAIGMNGEPLPVEHGFPVRLVVPGLYGYVSATKWLTRIELTGLDDFDGYWIPRGWSKDGPVKTQSRIDVPRSGASVRAGTVAVAGIAFAQHRGIERVEVRIDDGEWQPARLADEYTIDTWRQWVYEWDAPAGRHTIAVRATDGDGDTQTAAEARPDPDGATGHHTIEVDVV